MKLKENMIMKSSIIKQIFVLIVSFLAVMGLSFYSKLPSIIWLVVLWLVYMAYLKVDIKDKRAFFIVFLLAIIYSSLLVIGKQLQDTLGILWSYKTVIKILLLAIFFFPFLFLLFKKLENLKADDSSVKIKKRYVFITIFLGGFLAYLAIFPGVYGYDAGFQTLQFLDKTTPISTSYSLIFSGLLSLGVKTGKVLFDSYTIGFGFFTFIQLLFSSFVAYKVVLFTYKMTNNRVILILSTLFFSIFPHYLVMIISSAQDVLFSDFLILFLINIYEQAIDNTVIKEKKWLITTILYAFLMMLLRNNGVYVFIVFLPIFIIFNKKSFLFSLLVCLIPLFLYGIFNIIISSLGVVKGNSLREMLSIPSQQIARVYNYQKEEIADIKYVKEVFNNADFEIYLYNQEIADYMKGQLNTDLVKEDFVKFFDVYLKTGLNNPKNYIEAFFLNNIGLWYPDKRYYDAQMYHPYLEYEMLEAKKWNEKYIEIHRYSLIPIYEKVLNYVVNNNGLQRFPLLANTYTLGTYTFLYILIVMYVIYKRKYYLFKVLIIYLGLYATLLLAPVILFRYGLSIVMGWPILISMIYEANKIDNVKLFKRRKNEQN